MNTTRRFERLLDRLFAQYTEGLRRQVGKAGRGPIPRFGKKRLLQRIDELVDLARQIAIERTGREAFADSWSERRRWHPKQGKGYGVEAKKESFAIWYDETFGTKDCVYVFWSGRTCEYVGRTGQGGRRPRSHFERFWFRSVTRVDVYRIKTKRQVPMAECLAIDFFDPRRNKVRSARQKYRSACPVCSSERAVRQQLEKQFSPRRR